MALSRISCSADFATLFLRTSYAAASPRRPSVGRIHGIVTRRYPEAPRLRLPSNVADIINGETGRFGPERTRDIGMVVALNGAGAKAPFVPMTSKQFDSHVDSYDCFGTISLSGSMQTNVPKPFLASGRSTYLNMPGSEWAQVGKYLADGIHRSHYTVYRIDAASKILNGSLVSGRCYSSSADGPDCPTTAAKEEAKIVLSRKERLKKVANDYGKTVMVFHISLSLASLGIIYFLVSSGVNFEPMVKILSSGTAEEDNFVSSILNQGSVFVVAYSIHKILAPFRLSISLGCTPIIVKYLRKKGILGPMPKVG